MVISVWKDDICLSAEETLHICDEFGLTFVPILYYGEYSEGLVRHYHGRLNHARQEGFVIRICDQFKYNEFNRAVAKWVRKNHSSTDDSWKQNWVKNSLLTSTMS